MRTESDRAIDLAYKAVARRDLTVAELRTRLERKHVPPEAIDDAVAELEDTGFLDDARYAGQSFTFTLTEGEIPLPPDAAAPANASGNGGAATEEQLPTFIAPARLGAAGGRDAHARAGRGE